MTYLLNLPLPLYFMLLPLGIAVVLAANLYRVQSIFSKVKANYQAQLREAQNRLDEATKKEYFSMSHTTGVTENYYQEAHKKAEAELKEVTTKLHKAESDAVEREALIVQLRKDLASENEILSERLTDKAKQIELLRGNLDAYAHKSNVLDIKVSKWAFELDEKDELIEQLKSKLELSELAHSETKADIEQFEIQFKDALSVINRTKRATKQWEKIIKEKATKLANIAIEAVKRKQQQQQTEVVHDSIGVPRIVKADQSENDNGRHDVMAICDEVNRGIAQQAEAIRKELASVVDMSQLEVGDRIRFRDESFRAINHIAYIKPEHELDDQTIKVWFNDNPYGFYYNKGGSYETGTRHGRDIVQIIKQPRNK